MRKIGKLELVRPLSSNPSVPLFEARNGCSGPCTVREPVPGIPIDELIRSGPSRTAEWKVRVVSRICEALAYAHSQEVTHLGLRPASVLVTPGGDVKVVGFGTAPPCASRVEQAALDLYMAPEQIAGSRVDHRADIFSVGALACELFSVEPFSGGHPRHTLETTPHRRPDPASLPQTEYSPRLEAILRKALAHDPDDRYRRMAELHKAMEDLVHNSAEAFFERMLQADSAPARPAQSQASAPAATAANGAPGGSPPDRVQVLYNMALGQAAEGRLEEASKLARAIRRLAPDDPRNNEMTAYLLAEAETAVKAALASSPSGPRARALERRLESLRHPPRCRPVASSV